MLPFSQVDVFTSELMLGNPVAVVHGADGLSTAKMAAFARWTNLSETTFLLRPTDPAADYRVRIFTPVDELPFAGHPTLGSARAWLEQRGVPRSDGHLVQQCGAGLVRIRQADVDSPLPPLRWFGATVSTKRMSGLSRTLSGWTLMTSWMRSGQTTGQGGSRCCSPTPRPCSPCNRPEPAQSRHRRVRQDRRHRPLSGRVRCRLRGPRTYLEEHAWGRSGDRQFERRDSPMADPSRPRAAQLHSDPREQDAAARSHPR